MHKAIYLLTIALNNRQRHNEKKNIKSENVREARPFRRVRGHTATKVAMVTKLTVATVTTLVTMVTMVLVVIHVCRSSCAVSYFCPILTTVKCFDSRQCKSKEANSRISQLLGESAYVRGVAEK
jgi:hypothetical protein